MYEVGPPAQQQPGEHLAQELPAGGKGEQQRQGVHPVGKTQHHPTTASDGLYYELLASYFPSNEPRLLQHSGLSFNRFVIRSAKVYEWCLIADREGVVSIGFVVEFRPIVPR